MNPFKIWIVLLVLFLTGHAYSASKVRKVFMASDEIVTVRTALGIATIIQVPEKPNSVVLGDQNSFRVEYLDQAITIKPLHGGANEQVMHVLKEISDPARADEWMHKALAEKRKIMGFGHRVYKSGDSRVPTMKKYGLKLAQVKGQMKWAEISDILEGIMVKEKEIHPNLDFPAGPAYYLMGFDIDMFTPIFVMARITGWTAHIMEQTENNRIIRPLSEYTGHKERTVVPLKKR